MQKKNSRVLNSYKGFTLIELMVVIVILSVLAVWVAPKIMGRPDQAKQVKASVDIMGYETALKLYKLDNGSYPTTEQGFEALISKPDSGKLAKNWRSGGYLDKSKIAKDPWGNDFIYLSPGVHGDFDITSYGADGEPGGEEYNKDINSWEIE
ncbi:MAG: type II secretion system major pseudopilin GspG [Desulfobacteraceae bacterium]|jgi:general secretion pathway protein G|nr:type II secretion system major pseudopilin GspG [Desulfobacteraceae bacterium]